MNKVLSSIANDKKLAMSVIMGGAALSIISEFILLVGVYYSGIRKGVEVVTVEVEE